jgi:hypothetical protein
MVTAPAAAAARIQMRRSTTTQASSPPASAMANESPGEPNQDTRPSVGLSACENASLPQVKPPYGMRPRMASSATQTAAVQTGQPGSRMTSVTPSASGMKNSASNRARMIHGIGPTSMPVQSSSGRKNPAPNR